MLRRLSLPIVLWLFAGGFACTSMLGLDGDYQPSQLTSGIGGDVADPGSGGAGGSAINESGGKPWSAQEMGGAGAARAAGGLTGAGGDVPVRETGGAPPDAATCSPSDCGAGEKCCPTLSAVCVTLGPIVGCSAATCDACPAPPANGIDVCGPNGECAVRCNEGYNEQSGQCVSKGTGGSGSGGMPAAGGATGAV
jgi:hypothetical protein